ncbi:Protein F25E2.3 [Aphelenchoides avenae]|nr:Protein F25E2.3 [Aphelenchus avenae]
MHRHLRRFLGARKKATARRRLTTSVIDSDLSGIQCVTKHILELRRISDNSFVAEHLLKGRRGLDAIYGGQVLAHALDAATETVDDKFLPHSFHSYFIKSGNVHKPVYWTVERIRDGKSFCTRSVRAHQDNDVLFIAQFSFQVREGDAVSHQAKYPTNVPQPEDLRLGWEEIRLALGQPERVRNPINLKFLKIKEHQLLEMFRDILHIKPTDPEVWTFRKPMPEGDDGVPSYSMWVKAGEHLGDDAKLHRLFAAFMSDSIMMETAMLPHLHRGFVPSLLFSLDQCVYFHSPNINLDEWMLYEGWSPKAAGNRAFATSRLWSRDGRLVLSASQEGVVRARQ